MLTAAEFEIDQYGKPLIPLLPEELYAFGDRIRRVEELVLDLFSKGLLSVVNKLLYGEPAKFVVHHSRHELRGYGYYVGASQCVANSARTGVAWRTRARAAYSI